MDDEAPSIRSIGRSYRPAPLPALRPFRSSKRLERARRGRAHPGRCSVQAALERALASGQVAASEPGHRQWRGPAGRVPGLDSGFERVRRGRRGTEARLRGIISIGSIKTAVNDGGGLAICWVAEPEEGRPIGLPGARLRAPGPGPAAQARGGDPALGKGLADRVVATPNIWGRCAAGAPGRSRP